MKHKHIGTLIKSMRDRNHWSQAQMATALHLSKPTISLYEHFKRSISRRAVQSFMKLWALANAEEQRWLREWLK